MNPVFTFIVFVIFLLCQYAIWVCSNVISHWLGLTGKVYWAVVLVAFLLLNNLCFGAYEFSTELLEDEDESLYDWMEDDE